LGQFTGQKAARCENACPNDITDNKQCGIKKVESSVELHDQALSHHFLKMTKKEGAEPLNQVLQPSHPPLDGNVQSYFRHGPI
jgi:hypothetical protein